MKSKLKVDRLNKVIGSTSDLKFSERQEFCYRAAAVLVVNSQDQILVYKRPKEESYYPDRYDFSVASRCLDNEGINDCAYRAFYSKFNFEIEDFKFKAFFEPNKERKNIFHYLFEIQISNEIKFSNDDYFWVDKKDILGKINNSPDIFTPALKTCLVSLMDISNILIIDDNPIPSIKTVKKLIEKFNNGKCVLNFEYNKDSTEWDDLFSNRISYSYNNYYGRHFTFTLPENKIITIYFYNPKISIIENNNILIDEILQKKYYTHIWLDYGHSPIELVGEFDEIVVEKIEIPEHSSKSTEQVIKDSRMLGFFARAEQIAFYSYNPTLSHYKTSKIKEEIWGLLENHDQLNLTKNRIHFIETSETLKIYDFESRLAGTEETIPHNGKVETFLGTVEAYYAYGELLANILFDLHSYRENRINKKAISRYNFFNKNNYDFIKKVKTLNTNYRIYEKDGHNISRFKLGLISFQFLDIEKIHFLLDTPYKEYYKKYDDVIKINDTLSPIFNNNRQVKDDRIWIKYIYNLSFVNEKYIMDVYVQCKYSEFKEAAKEFIKYVHTAVFYDPTLFNSINSKKNQESLIDINFKEDLTYLLDKERVELIYYINETHILNSKGILHYAIFRKIPKNSYEYFSEEEISSYHIEEINHSFGRSIILPLVEETIFPNIEKNIKQKSLLNALSTVLNRNGSHNLGSHVLAILSSEDLVKQFLEKDRDNDNFINVSDVIYHPVYYKHINWSGKHPEKQSKESLVAYFNAYLKNRLDLLAAVGTSGEAVMLNNKPLFKGVFKNFERNLVLLEHISGKGEDFKYNFCLTVNDISCTENDIDIEVAMPNDLLGDQAFYLLLENIIRNTAKHGNYKSNERVVFTINVNTTASKEDFYAVEVWDSNCLDERVENENKSLTEEKPKKSRATIVAETNERIDKDILREDFNIREGGWGTIEMKIACCYLSGLPLKKIDDDAYRTDAINDRLPIIEAIDKEVRVDANKSNHLAYRFYIQKPKSVLVVDIDDQLNEDERKAKSLTEKGITILTNDELKEAITARTIYKHQFMVAFAKAETDVTSQLKGWYDNKKLPNRVLKISERKLISSNLLSHCHWQSFKSTLPTVSENPQYDLNAKQQIVININGDFSYYDTLYSEAIENSEYKDFLDLYNKEKIEYNLEACFPHHATAPTDEITRYVEPYGSISSLGLLFKQSFNDNHTLYNTLKEAVNDKVLVIDERIQNGMTKTFKPDSDSGDEVSFERIYKDTGVIVPSKNEINLNKPKEEVDEIKEFIFDVLENNQIDYFILHFGILEKIVPNATKEGFKEFLKECRGKQEEFPTKIVLTSGRGIPSDLPDDEYFCNFSSIDYYLSDTNGRSKTHLVQLLKNQRVK